MYMAQPQQQSLYPPQYEQQQQQLQFTSQPQWSPQPVESSGGVGGGGEPPSSSSQIASSHKKPWTKHLRVHRWRVTRKGASIARGAYAAAREAAVDLTPSFSGSGEEDVDPGDFDAGDDWGSVGGGGGASASGAASGGGGGGGGAADVFDDDDAWAAVASR